jgi:hypothetical protein
VASSAMNIEGVPRPSSAIGRYEHAKSLSEVAWKAKRF